MTVDDNNSLSDLASSSCDAQEVSKANVQRLELDSQCFPHSVRVGGLPLMMWGWTGEYTRCRVMNAWEYHLKSHSYWGIPIRHTAIRLVSLNDSKRWCLVLDDGSFEAGSVIRIGPHEHSTFGAWSDGMTVVPLPSGRM